MSMDFVSVKDEKISFNISNRGWRRIFFLALMYGWKPAGTVGYGDSQTYFLNDGQLVTREDALELGRAIEMAIPDLKEADPANDPVSQFGSDWELEMWERTFECIVESRRDPAYIFFDSIWSQKLTELVELCQAGEFRIY
mgnify:FL=1|jgi:hypothetical protein